MRTAGVVIGEEGRQPGDALGAVGPDPSVGPLTQAGLDEASGLTVGLETIVASESMFDAEGLARVREQLRTEPVSEPLAVLVKAIFVIFVAQPASADNIKFSSFSVLTDKMETLLAVRQ